MVTTKSAAKSSPAKRPAPVAAPGAAKAKPATKAKLAPATKARAAPKTAASKAVPKAAAKAATKAANPRAKKPASVPPEQRSHYIEIAAYHIAERRGFAPGNPLDDWVQAEAEIDRLLAQGLLGGLGG